MDFGRAILGIAGLLLASSPSAIAQNGPMVQSSPGVSAQKPTAPSELGKGQYLLTIPHVIGHDNPHGCANAGWDCMTNLCKAELGPASGRSEGRRAISGSALLRVRFTTRSSRDGSLTAVV
jgi:hypothetical protein